MTEHDHYTKNYLWLSMNTNILLWLFMNTKNHLLRIIYDLVWIDSFMVLIPGEQNIIHVFTSSWIQFLSDNRTKSYHGDKRLRENE